jgi:hypothetical protein
MCKFKVGDRVIQEGARPSRSYYHAVGFVKEIRTGEPYPILVEYENGLVNYDFEGNRFPFVTDDNCTIRHFTPLDELL